MPEPSGHSINEHFRREGIFVPLAIFAVTLVAAVVAFVVL
jgi:uncharacterized membrane protein